MQKQMRAAGQYRPAINRIFHDAAHPSRLILQIIERCIRHRDDYARAR